MADDANKGGDEGGGSDAAENGDDDNKTDTLTLICHASVCTSS